MKYLIFLILFGCTKEQLVTVKPIEQSFNGFDLEVFNDINEVRESYGLSKLKGEKVLSVGCLQHVNYMTSINSLSHDYFWQRYTNSGAVRFGEVVAYGYYTPLSFVSGYTGSPDHLNALLGDYTHIGIATVGLYQCIDLAKYKN